MIKKIFFSLLLMLVCINVYAANDEYFYYDSETGEYVAVYDVSIVNSKNSVSVDGGYAVVDNVSFINNADVISVVDGTMEIVGCYFLNNSNVVDLKSAYDVFISDSTFINNTDIINTFYSTLTVNNTSFKGSDAGSYCVNLVDSNAKIYSSKFNEVNLNERNKRFW